MVGISPIGLMGLIRICEDNRYRISHFFGSSAVQLDKK